VELKFVIEEINLWGGNFRVKYFSHLKNDDAALTIVLSFPSRFAERTAPESADLIAIAKINFPFDYFKNRKKELDFFESQKNDLEKYKDIINKEINFGKKEISELSNKYYEPANDTDNSETIPIELFKTKELNRIRRVVIEVLEELQILK